MLPSLASLGKGERITMASTKDLEVGWFMYRENPTLTLDEINKRLRLKGHDPASDRAFSHYRKLYKNRGPSSPYIPINRLDVKKTEEELFFSSDALMQEKCLYCFESVTGDEVSALWKERLPAWSPPARKGGGPNRGKWGPFTGNVAHEECINRKLTELKGEEDE